MGDGVLEEECGGGDGGGAESGSGDVRHDGGEMLRDGRGVHHDDDDGDDVQEDRGLPFEDAKVVSKRAR